VALATFLVDNSVWARVGRPAVREVMDVLADRREIATCGVIDLEVLFSARSGAEHARAAEDRRALSRLAMPDELWARAAEVQGLLARRGQHRATSIPDLLIAATAEHHGATVLHYDADFELIAEVTGQPTRWVVPRGSVE
jgi:predicted nucleic acid-binding protein